MKRCFYLLIFAALALRGQVPSDSVIRAILADRIDTLHQGVGIVVGIVDAHARRFVSYGSFSVTDPRPVGNDTVFEIGSTTKVFTSTILADMVQRGEVSLDDPVAKYLPGGVKMPQRGGKQITLIDLATHTSGLPRMPSNFAPKDIENPYADYTVANLFQFLSSYELKRDIAPRAARGPSDLGHRGHGRAERRFHVSQVRCNEGEHVARVGPQGAGERRQVPVGCRVTRLIVARGQPRFHLG